MPLTSLMTPTGRGAVATIVYDGPVDLIDDAGLFRAANSKPLAGQPLDQVIFGHWGPEPGEEVVLCRTSPTTLEIHCHGGQAASDAILLALDELGGERLESWEYLDRTRGPFERQAAEALATAPTPRTAGIIARQTAGPLRAALARLAGEETTADELAETIDAILEWADFARHLWEPWQVVLFGRPNVGKSSLMNALAGYERAIVLDAPGTTRDLVTAELALDGWPIRLTDTAGLRSGADELETSGINRARDSVANAELRILVLNRSATPMEEELTLMDESGDGLVVANKCDLADVWGDKLPPAAIPISARRGEGLDELTVAIVNRLIPAIPDINVPLPVSATQLEALQSARAAVSGNDLAGARRLCRWLWHSPQ